MSWKLSEVLALLSVVIWISCVDPAATFQLLHLRSNSVWKVSLAWNRNESNSRARPANCCFGEQCQVPRPWLRCCGYLKKTYVSTRVQKVMKHQDDGCSAHYSSVARNKSHKEFQANALERTRSILIRAIGSVRLSSSGSLGTWELRLHAEK